LRRSTFLAGRAEEPGTSIKHVPSLVLKTETRVNVAHRVQPCFWRSISGRLLGQEGIGVGGSIILNSDDPTLFECSLESEYALAAREFAFTPAEVGEIAGNARVFAFS